VGGQDAGSTQKDPLGADCFFGKDGGGKKDLKKKNGGGYEGRNCGGTRYASAVEEAITRKKKKSEKGKFGGPKGSAKEMAGHQKELDWGSNASTWKKLPPKKMGF